MCPPGDSTVYNFRPTMVSSIGGVGPRQQTSPKHSPKHSSIIVPSGSYLMPPPFPFSLRALLQNSSARPSPLIFCVRGGHVTSVSSVVDAASARSLVAPEVAPLLCQSCDCTGMFVMETYGESSVCNVLRLTFSIICSGWFIPDSLQQSPLRVTAGDVFHVSIKNVPFK
jgi:hypothetical protein